MCVADWETNFAELAKYSNHGVMGNWNERLRASGIYLGISLAIAGLVAALVFGLWYSYPYRDISGGRELFILMVVVNVVMVP